MAVFDSCLHVTVRDYMSVVIVEKSYGLKHTHF